MAFDKKYRFFDDVSMGVQVISPEMRYIYLNKELLSQIQMSEEEISGYSMTEKFPGIEKTDVFKEIQKSLSTGEDNKIINEFIFEDGRRTFHELNFCKVPDGVMIFSSDITDSKMGEKLLQESNELLEQKVHQKTTELEKSNENLQKKIAEVEKLNLDFEKSQHQLEKQKNIHNAIEEMAKIGGWEIDLENNTVWWSPEVHRIHEVDEDFKPTVEEGINFYHPDDIPVITELVTQAVQDGISFNRELRIITSKGNVKHVQTHGTANRKNGKTTKIYGAFQDITEQIKIENALREKELQMRTILDTLPDGVISIYETGQIQMFNPAAEELFGYQAEEVLGKNIKMLMPEPQRSEHDSYIQNYLKTGEKKVIGMSREVLGMRADGSSFPMYLSIGELESNGRKMFTGIVHDLTAIYAAKDAAEVANQAKSEFLAAMSHEIRTPMNAVIGFSDLLSVLISDKTQKSYIESIQTASKSLLTLINDILDLSKVEAGRLEIQYETISPHFLLQEIEQIFKVKIQEKHLDFLLEIDPELPEFLVLDEVRLRQGLINLVGNAIKFTERGHIKLCVRKDQAHEEQGKIDLIIEVEDTGIGIALDQQELIFESFRQQDGQSARKYGGTGLGLSLTKKLIELMNGRISVKSTLNEGSLFTIQLREVAVSQKAPLAYRTKEVFKPQQFTFQEGRVLVVDDIESNRILVKEVLVEAGLDVVEVDNGHSALLATDEYNPSVILMDIRMPVMDGYEATNKLRSNPKTSQIPIIAVSASVSIEEKNTFKDRGFDGYLSKPLNLNGLLAELSLHIPCEKVTLVEEDQHESDLSEIVDLEWTVPSELMERLENRLKKQWKEVKEYGVFDGIAAFAAQLSELGTDYQIPPLVNFGSTLKFQTDSFDIEGMNVTLDSYPDLLEQLRTKQY
ncbi:MAG: PAS domain S-box protein [SAR324 cluster bacterium]|nr:PAS domain S-box protein [SAR324 cluster bacterium]